MPTRRWKSSPGNRAWSRQFAAAGENRVTNRLAVSSRKGFLRNPRQTTGVVNLNSTNTTLSYYNYAFDRIGDRTSIWDNGTDVSNWAYDCTGQLQVDFYRPATTALNWNGLTAGQWD